KLFTAHCVDEITNLSAVRRQLFHDVIGPCCVLIVGRAACDPATELYYFTPKPSQFDSGNGVFCIEPQDVARLSHGEALSDSLI
ncbi:MAG: hypothetical protein NT069_13580, partial [Planctomycetota bacterium]|nr:hypothetical protein [Planctomycetota bacterium]